MTQTSEKVTLKYMNTDDLVPYIYNPRDNEQAVEAVAESIRNFGFKIPIIIDAVGEIVTGHTLILKTSTRKGDNVLDVFGGSGSTLIACEQLGRTCYMNELDPQYVDVIIRRWEKVSGDKAAKIN